MSEVAGMKLLVKKSFVDAVVVQEDDDDQLLRTLTAPAAYAGQEPKHEPEEASTLSADHPLQWVASTPPDSPVMSYRYPLDVPMSSIHCNQCSPLAHIDPFKSNSGSESVMNFDMPMMSPGEFHPSEEESTSASEDGEAALRKRTSCAGQPWYPVQGPSAPPLHVPSAPMVMQAMALPVPAPPISGAMTPGPAVMAASGPFAVAMTAPAPMAAASGPGASLSPPTYAAMFQVMSMPMAIVSTVPEMPARTTCAPFLWPIPRDVPVPVPMSMPVMPKMPEHEPRIPFGTHHRFHHETITTGDVSEDHREVVKKEFMGRLSVITEDQVHHGGILRYAVQFSEGELSNADGVGFIFSSKLPCPKNIQKIVSIFVNRTGRICLRAQSDVIRCDMCVRRIHIGDWVSAVVDLDRRTAEFTVWPSRGGAHSSATLDFGAMLDAKRRTMPSLPKAACGYFACVVKNIGVGIRLGS
mmetsp:Transcript_8435/g.21703  ORF Transcript_8435/g.21703 Transcript_8435/m.21703 type:complete len:468 (+) Transcript_8435:102-1505(+)